MMTFDPTSVYEEACNAGCFPELQLSTCQQYCDGDGASEGQTIFDIAMGNADFSTLVAAITAAGLTDVISGEGPFTVFAPTNEAFAALPEETLESLLLPENIEQLQDILKYHAVAGLYPSSSLTSGAVETLSGYSITITAVSGSGIIVNDAEVITADIMASNGIIHVIDKVLLPPSDVVTDEPANGIVDESADADTTPMTEDSVEAVIPESQGNNTGNTVAANSDVSPESSPDPAEDTIAAVSVDTTISAASLENSGSSALSISVYAMASIPALFFVSS